MFDVPCPSGAHSLLPGLGLGCQADLGMLVSTCSPFSANPLGDGGSWRGKGEDTDTACTAAAE